MFRNLARCVSSCFLNRSSVGSSRISGSVSFHSLKRGALHSSEKRTRFFLNKRILKNFSWIFLENKRIFAKGVRDFRE